MNKKVLITTAVIIVVLLVGSGMIYRAIENRIFDELASGRMGGTIHAGWKRGGLFSGYDLHNVSIHNPPSRRDSAGSTFTSPKMTIHWKLNPFHLTEISWDEASVTLEYEGDKKEEFPVGPCMMAVSDGWLATESPVRIGEPGWEGEANLKISLDGREMDSSVKIKKLPGRFMTLSGDAPPGAQVPNYIIVDMTVSGKQPNLETRGTLTNPDNGQSFRF
jgi:hypothetical protein